MASTLPATATDAIPATPTGAAWTAHDYPMVMVGLSLDVRQQAIEMANSLRDEGLSEQRAIALSLVRACDQLDATDGHPIAPTEPHPGTAALAQHIIYEAGAWQVVTGLPHETTAPTRSFDSLDDALGCAYQQARDDTDAGFYVYVDQTIVTDPVECFGRRWLGGPALFHVEPWEGGWTVRRIAGDSRFFESLDDPDRGATHDDDRTPTAHGGRWLCDRLTDTHRTADDSPASRIA